MKFKLDIFFEKNIKNRGKGKIEETEFSDQ